MPIYRVGNNIYSHRVVPGRHSGGSANTANLVSGVYTRKPIRPAPVPEALTFRRTVELSGPAGQQLDGVLFTKAPTFPTGTVTPGVRTITGVLFVKAPTFPTGTATSGASLTGVLFTKAPTFNIGVVTATRVLTGTLFTKAPTFPTGAVSLSGGPQTLNGSLFTKAPTFPAGSVGRVLRGTLFTKAPTFPLGVVTKGYIGGLPSAAVIGLWDARSITGADNDPVASWADIGPLAQSALAQGTSGFRPVLDTDGWGGGIRSVLFDGTDDRLDNTLDQSYTGDFAFIAVLELLTYPTGTAAVVYTTGFVPDKNILGVDDVEEPPGWVVMSGPEGTQEEHHHGTVLNLESVPVRVVMTQIVYNGGAHKLWERASLVINEIDSAQGDPLNNMGALKVGARENNARFMNMRLGYLVLVDMADTNETTLLLARDALGLQFAVPGMLAQVLQGALFSKAPTFFAGKVNLKVAGSLFTKAPTFPQGALSVAPGAQTVSGSLFQKAPTFPTGKLNLRLAGVLFQKAPTFPTGKLNLRIAGSLFTKTPTFPQGVLSAAGGPQTLSGVVFQKAATFPQGTVTSLRTVTGVLFQKAPTFPVGAVGRVVAGVLFTKSPTFFAGAVFPDQMVVGVLFQKAPTFFVGTVTVHGLTFWTRNPVAFTRAPVAFTRVTGEDDPPW